MSKLWLAAGLALLAGCSTIPWPKPDVVRVPSVGRFSEAKPGETLPSGWQPWTLSGFKTPTQYRLVSDGGHTVMKATAKASASGLIYPVHVDLREHPVLQWRWKVPALIASADNTKRSKEDAPVRVVIAFSGDVSRLGFDDRLFAQQFKMLTRRELPYATLMYIWENRLAEGETIANAHTSRIKMIVAETGAQRLGEWFSETRNVYEDYKGAFNEEPPPVQWIAIMTDTDNTGETVDAYYGDMAFMREAPRASAPFADQWPGTLN